MEIMKRMKLKVEIREKRKEVKIRIRKEKKKGRKERGEEAVKESTEKVFVNVMC